MSARFEPEHANEQRSGERLGAYLKKLRQAKGYTVEQVSMRTKYSGQQIQALEDEQWQVLPEGVPLRWLVRSYARFLEIDEQVLQAMLDEVIPATHQPAGGSRQVHWEGQDMSLYVAPRQRTWGWWLIALVLIVVVLFYAIDQGWIPESWLIFDWLRTLNR